MRSPNVSFRARIDAANAVHAARLSSTSGRSSACHAPIASIICVPARR